MRISIDNRKFDSAHQLFLESMFEKSGGIEFSGFRHPVIVNNEIAYKWGVYNDATKILELNKWRRWLSTTGQIMGVMKRIFDGNISKNLVEHRYGGLGNPVKPLHKVKSILEKKNLEIELNHFFNGGKSSYDDFGLRFNRLVSYLKSNNLGCVWQFMAYLSFLVDPNKYFCILAGKFEELLQYYGNDVTLNRNVSWENYKAVLDLADLISDKLIIYEYADRIAIHSYMWIVANLINKKTSNKPRKNAHNLDSELIKRLERAAKRERLGFIGEQYVMNQEIIKLRESGRTDLAEKVNLNSATNDEKGYDILSFTPEGGKILIEVKSTSGSAQSDYGFWLTQNEFLAGKENSNWKIYRVHEVDTTPRHIDLGNIIQSESSEWDINTSSFFVCRK